jgi:hypothetical protein
MNTVSGNISRLQELLDRKESVTSKMDSFQITEEIEQTAVSILRSIFEPYKVEEVPSVGLTRKPDGMVKYDALGRTRNRVFFEIKAGRIAYYDLKMIKDMMRELRFVYTSRFYSLIFIARSFDSEIVSRMARERTDYPGKLTLISIEALISLYQKLTVEREFMKNENRLSALLNLLEAEGVVSPKEILEYVGLPEEYSFEMSRLSASTRDEVPVEIDLSLKTVPIGERFRRSMDQGKISSSEDVKMLILSEIKEVTAKHSLFDFAFDHDRTLDSLREEFNDILRKQDLKVANFECSWHFNQQTQSNIERSRQLVCKSSPLREEIETLNRLLNETFLDLRTHISRLNANLASLDTNYLRGVVTEKEYLVQLDELNREIVSFKEKIKI